MAVNVYEGMYIFDSGRYGRNTATVSDQVTEIVEKAGGEMLVSRLWEERRLAYPIKGQRKGTYWLTYFRIEGEKLAGLSRHCEISDDILRHLYIKIEERLVDPLLSHARGEVLHPETAAEGESEDASPAQAGDGGTNGEAEPVAAAVEATENQDAS